MTLLERYGLQDLSPEIMLELSDELDQAATERLEAADLPPAAMAELDRRLAKIEAGEAKFIPWEVVKAELEAELRR